MADRTLQLLLSDGTFFEAPRWRNGRWYVSDFFRHRVIAVDPRGREEMVLDVPEQPSGLGWLPDGSLIVASMKDKKLLRRRTDGKVSVHADVSALCGGLLNDIVVDEKGRAWCGNFGFDFTGGEEARPANLIRVDSDGSVHLAASGLQFPNGSVVTPGGNTLIVGELRGACYTAFTIGADGALTGRRVWAALPGVVPDGCCLDANGHIWCSDPRGQRLVHVAEGGRILEEVAIPGGMTTFACMLGGEDGRTLLVACKPPSAPGDSSKRDAVLMTMRVETPHAGRP